MKESFIHLIYVFRDLMSVSISRYSIRDSSRHFWCAINFFHQIFIEDFALILMREKTYEVRLLLLYVTNYNMTIIYAEGRMNQKAIWEKNWIQFC